MRRCSGVVDASALQQCKETFNLYYYEANSDFGNDALPTWDSNTYTMVDKIAVDEINSYNNSGTHSEYQNVVTRVIPPPSSRRDLSLNGVYFAIQNEGACVTLMRIRVYYVTCDAIYAKFAYVPMSPTRSLSMVEQTGQCVANAVGKTSLANLCQYDGTWLGGFRGECVCQAGYQGNVTSNSCSACPSGQYKWSLGPGLCSPCPKYSSSGPGASECDCQMVYYRHPQDPKSDPCTRYPTILIIHYIISALCVVFFCIIPVIVCLACCVRWQIESWLRSRRSRKHLTEVGVGVEMNPGVGVE